MIRDTLEPNAKHYSLFMMGDGNRMGQFFRSCVNCYTGWNDQPRIYDRSVYMKITKTGNTFEAFYRKVGSDEDAWAKIGETKAIDFSNAYFYVGIAVSADTNGKTATISGSGFTITGDMYYFPSAAPSISAAPSAYSKFADHICFISIRMSIILIDITLISLQLLLKILEMLVRLVVQPNLVMVK